MVLFPYSPPFYSDSMSALPEKERQLPPLIAQTERSRLIMRNLYVLFVFPTVLTSFRAHLMSVVIHLQASTRFIREADESLARRVAVRTLRTRTVIRCVSKIHK